MSRAPQRFGAQSAPWAAQLRGRRGHGPRRGPLPRRFELAGELIAKGSEEDEGPTQGTAWDVHRCQVRREVIPVVAKARDHSGMSSNMSDSRDPGAAVVREICIRVPSIAQMCELARSAAQRRAFSGGGETQRTTLMLQRIAYDLDEAGVRHILDARGLAGTYDAVYVPRKSAKADNLGYAFVNFARPSYAALCIFICSGICFGKGEVDPSRVCSVEYSKGQGLAFMLRSMEKSRKASRLTRGTELSACGGRAE